MSERLRRSEDERIDAEASDWFARRKDARNAEDDVVFERWLDADPRHGAAFDEYAQAWEDLGELGHLRALADPAPPRSRLVEVLKHAFRGPRLAFGVTGFAAAAMAFAVFAPQLLDRPDARHQTEIAQIEELTLPDGSVVTLGARSELDVDFSSGERRVRLRSGEAFFDIVHDAGRPFFVDVGGTLVRVVGTRFDVRNVDGQVRVAVQEGVVEVTPRRNEVQTLRAGQRLELVQPVSFLAPAPAPPRLDVVQASHVAAWREGRLSYNDQPMSEVIADINRYYRPGAELSSAAAGEMRITTSFRADEIEAFLNTLSAGMPVAVEREGNGRYRIEASPGGR